MATRPLTGTYRLQLHKDFPLPRAAEVVDYLDRLGVTHLYASPILQARPGSTHGYDVADFARVNPELGGDDARVRLVKALRARGLGLVVDIVPNHMGTGPANPYWEDMLEHGPQSRWAHLFDVDWESPVPGLAGKVLLPVLGEPIEALIAKGDLKVTRAPGKPPRVAYFDDTFPLSPASLALLPATGEPDADTLASILERQHYLLADWRRAPAEIDYRRFFDVNELAAVRAEDARVFEAMHAVPLAWIAAGELDGLRIDHIDGLLDPAEYMRRLRDAVGAHLPAGVAADTFPVFVEKILSPGEHLLAGWPVQGTTGYEYLNDLEAVFLDDQGTARIEASYRRMLRVREGVDFHEVAIRGKLKILRTAFQSDVERLVRRVVPVVRRDPRGAGLARRAILEAVVQLLAAMPVYRTYVDPRGRPTPDDVALVERALARATERGAARPLALQLVADVLLLRDQGTRTEADAAERLAFVQRFQQTSGPATAKGIEDTALYLYFPLASRNEVGGEPDRDLSDVVGTFHRGAAERATSWPVALLCTNTHDTKRSADVRARLDVLSEMPDAWERFVARARPHAAPFRRRDEGRTLPDVNTEYLFLQTALAVWPLDAAPGGDAGALPPADVLSALADRVHAYLLKATREGKMMTTWTEPNTAFEEALEAYVRAAFDPAKGGALLGEVARLAARVSGPGMWNALSRVLFHFTTPGTPDLYQGDELWNFALVDPDNRRPVDYALRERMLARIEAARDDEARLALLRDAVRAPADGMVKLFLTHRLLQARRDHAALFREGTYQPVDGAGPHARHLMAFAREHDGTAALAVGARLTLGLGAGAEAPVGARWKETTLALPASLQGMRWRCGLTGLALPSLAATALDLSMVLADAPVALLLGERA